MQLPRRKNEEWRLMNQDRDAFLTPSAIEGLKRELDRLKRERPAMVEELSRNREMGDLSENAGYHIAKAKLRSTDSRILSIEDRIKMAVPIDVRSDGSGRIRIGSTVVLQVSGKELTYEILGTQESNPFRGKISYKSPLGQLLLGHEAGETLVLKTDAGETKYEIQEVR